MANLKTNEIFGSLEVVFSESKSGENFAQW